MNKLAKVSHLDGLKFTVSSGNPARVEVIGPGGLRVVFRFKPTLEDMQEADAYLVSKMDANVTAHSVDHGKVSTQTREEEFEDYRKFLLDNS